MYSRNEDNFLRSRYRQTGIKQNWRVRKIGRLRQNFSGEKKNGCVLMPVLLAV